jgi:hypothetical protein
LIDKPSYGAGATTLAKFAAVIATGREPAVMPFSTEMEGTKHLTAALIEAREVLILDNLKDGTPLACSLFAQTLTESLVDVRQLGTSLTHQCDTRRLAIATGVNVSTADDLNRRMLPCRLDPKVENPEARTFKRSELLADVRRERVALLSDLFTITAAYLHSGEHAAVGTLAGFQQFVRWVAEPLKWLGMENVISAVKTATATDNTVMLLTRIIPLLKKLQDRPEFENAKGLLAADMLMPDVMMSDSLKKALAQRAAEGALAGEPSTDEIAWQTLRDKLSAALGEATGAKPFQGSYQNQIDSVKVGRWLARIVGRVVMVDNKPCRVKSNDKSHGSLLWTVEDMDRKSSNESGGSGGSGGSF